MAKAKTPEIFLDHRNVNRHDERSKSSVRKSLEDLGAGRSIVIDSENTLVAGECTYEQAQALGMKTRIVETDGTELVIVKRKDLSPDDPRRRALAIADNKTGKLSEFDYEGLSDELQALNDLALDFELPDDFVNATGFDDVELEPLLAAEWSPPTPEDERDAVPPSPPPTTADAYQNALSSPGANPGDNPGSPSMYPGGQTGGRAIFFGEDQLEVIRSAIAYAKKEQGDEASEAELLVWCLLQVLP